MPPCPQHQAKSGDLCTCPLCHQFTKDCGKIFRNMAFSSSFVIICYFKVNNTIYDLPLGIFPRFYGSCPPHPKHAWLKASSMVNVKNVFKQTLQYILKYFFSQGMSGFLHSFRHHNLSAYLNELFLVFEFITCYSNRLLAAVTNYHHLQNIIFRRLFQRFHHYTSVLVP